MTAERPAPPSRAFPYHLVVEATLRDTDGLGHINNAVYVTWLEEIRTRYVFDRRGLSELSQFDFILASTTIEYLSPVSLHETVDLYCAPCRVGNRSWDMIYEGRARRDGRRVMTARAVLVQYDFDKGTSAPIPEPFRRILERDLVVPEP